MCTLLKKAPVVLFDKVQLILVIFGKWIQKRLSKNALFVMFDKVHLILTKTPGLEKHVPHHSYVLTLPEIPFQEQHAHFDVCRCLDIFKSLYAFWI